LNRKIRTMFGLFIRARVRASRRMRSRLISSLNSPERNFIATSISRSGSSAR